MVTEGSKACRGTLHPLLPAEAVDRQELRMQLGPPHVHLQQRGRVFEKRPERRPFVVKLLIAKKLDPTPPHPLPRGCAGLGLAGCLQPTALTQTPTQRQNSTKKRVSLQGCHPLRCFASACRRIASMRQFCFDREVTSPEAIEKKLFKVHPTQGAKKVADAAERNMTRNRDHVRTLRLACLGPLLQTQSSIN